LEANGGLPQPAGSGAVATDISLAATPQAGKSAYDRGNPAKLLPASNASDGSVPLRVEVRGEARKVVLDESLMITTIARKNPDGSISLEYTTGTENGAKAFAERQRLYPRKKGDLQ